MEMSEIEQKLQEIKNKYPNEEFKILNFMNSDLNIMFATRGHSGTILINSYPYQGVVCTNIEQSFSDNLVVVQLIIRIDSFLESNIKARGIINQYGM
jgi:hypothetical protein